MKKSAMSGTNSPSKTEHGLTKQNKLFFANVSNHLNKQMIGGPSNVLKMQPNQPGNNQKKIFLGKDKVAYNEKSTTPNSMTPVLTQNQRLGELMRGKNST